MILVYQKQVEVAVRPVGVGSYLELQITYYGPLSTQKLPSWLGRLSLPDNLQCLEEGLLVSVFKMEKGMHSWPIMNLGFLLKNPLQVH